VHRLGCTFDDEACIPHNLYCVAFATELEPETKKHVLFPLAGKTKCGTIPCHDDPTIRTYHLKVPRRNIRFMTHAASLPVHRRAFWRSLVSLDHLHHVFGPHIHLKIRQTRRLITILRETCRYV